MSEFWPFIIIGLSTGAVYGLSAIGLVLTYKTSGIFNFAHGAIATMGMVLVFLMYAAHDWPLWLTLLDAVFIAGPLMGLLMEQIARALNKANASYKVVATLGLVLTVNFLAPTMVAADNDVQDLPRGSGLGRRAQWLPRGSFELAGVNVGYDKLVVFIVGVVSAIALTVFLRRTRLGVQTRAVVDDPDLLSLEGTNPVAIRRSSWVLGSTFGALSGALLAPQLGQNFAALGSLVVKAAGAAALGAFTSLPLAFVGGLVIGVAEAVLTKQFSANQSWVNGLPTAVPFIVLFLVLILIPRRWLRETFNALPHKERVPRHVPRWLAIGPYALVGIVFSGIPVVIEFPTSYTRFLVYVLLFLSMGLLVKTSGQLSLGHFAFAAIGSAMFHHFAASAGMPWLLALVLAGLVAVPVGALVALPAVRLSGVFLALATYAFAIALEALFYRSSTMFSRDISGVFSPRPSMADSDKKFFYVVLAILVVSFIVMTMIDRGRLGRLLRALGESPTALETQGTTVNVVRTAVFCISAFFAAIAGALFGATNIFVTGQEFSADAGLILLVLVMLAPGRQPWFAIAAALGLAVLRNDIDLPDIGFVDVNLTFQLIFGALATRLAVVAYRRRRNIGLRQLWRRLVDRVAPPIKVEAIAAGASTPVDAGSLAARERPPGSGLEIHEMSVRYGTLVAVDSLTLMAPTGRITGLVGPNGAGKSTTFDACSGLIRPSAGRVVLDGHDVTELGPAERARLGMGRTFQRVRLWNAMSVEQNVSLGREGAMAGRNPVRQLAASRAQAKEIAQTTDAALALCGIEHLRHQLTGGLTTGQRRLVELARCLAGDYDMLLLDEPSSGLDTLETERFGEILKSVVRHRGCGILLVEHDMNLVMDVCEYIYVLDVGQLIFEGTPEQVRASEKVQAAYLGSTAVTV